MKKNKDQLKRVANTTKVVTPKAVTRQQPIDSVSSSSANELEITNLWSNEIDQLSSRSFSSMTEAIEVIADCVLAKSQVGEATKDQREMLITLFETDPELQEQIAKLCTININR